MLEAVVEHDRIGTVCRRSRGRSHAVAVGDMGHVGEQEREFRGLVARRAACGAVAPAHDGGAACSGEAAACHPGHERRLAGAAEREVADGDHRHGHPPHGQQTAVVREVAAAHGGGIGRGEECQGRAGESRCRAGLGAVDEPAERSGVGKKRHAGHAHETPRRRACRRPGPRAR